ncbi:hypothetical protein HMPREF9965_1310 [Streptococcus mitis bv. 2 str. SK95]|uniref:Uncharacterized protein n=1 Tax=Streptococcus mitis bv. 2 str. SK95 TaxID=1000588 RepID=F9LXE4_STROR|nr:hypothetical protein [Streptococcus mitis]EGU65690.1 hypothetical protein HMPREF9965_1310 [Streptococcus mitis bv. 2 str. SK95]
MNHLVQSLKEKITDQMYLEDMVNVFEEMCGTPFDEEMILFETGTFTRLSNDPLFQISLVRQVPNDDEEFYQVHLAIFYRPTSKNAEFSESIWDEDLDENIFDYIRNSEVFADAKEKEYLKVKIYLDET